MTRNALIQNQNVIKQHLCVGAMLCHDTLYPCQGHKLPLSMVGRNALSSAQLRKACKATRSTAELWI